MKIDKLVPSLLLLTGLYIIGSLLTTSLYQGSDIKDNNDIQPTISVSEEVKDSTSEITYEELLNSVRTPRGFSSVEAVNRFAVEKGIIKDTEDLQKKITVGEVAEVLVNTDRYRELNDGFSDKVKKEDIDLTKVPTDSGYSSYLTEALIRGWLTSEQVSIPDSTMTLNEFTRITYHIGFNSLKYEKPSEEVIDATLELFPNISREDPSCRIAKVMFLSKYDLIPFTYKGEFPLDLVITKQDLVNMVITFTDVLDLEGIDSDNPNQGCQPCEDAALTLDREKYSE